MGRILILGAGGHAKVIADILQLRGMQVIGYLDDDSEKWGLRLLGLPVLGAIATCAGYEVDGAIVGIGLNSRRRSVVEHYDHVFRGRWVNAIHPKATLAASVRVGCGVFVGAGVIASPDATIGNHVIVNTAAVVGHDSHIADFVHVGPTSTITGGVTIGEETFIGTGVSIIPEVHIGRQATIGAGASVVRDIPDGVTAVGVPARWKQAGAG
jgi:sugar O-acyltransferase (sialic acid O-acetyltransferase NeuD family)